MRTTENSANLLLAAITAKDFPKKSKTEWLELIDAASQKTPASAIETQPALIVEDDGTAVEIQRVNQSMIDTQPAPALNTIDLEVEGKDADVVSEVTSLDSTPALHSTLAGRRLEQYLLLSPEINEVISSAISQVMQGFGERTGLLLSAQNIATVHQFDEFVSAYFEAQGNSGVANRATFIELFLDDVADALLLKLIEKYQINVSALESSTGLYANKYTVSEQELRDIIQRLLSKLPQF